MGGMLNGLKAALPVLWSKIECPSTGVGNVVLCYTAHLVSEGLHGDWQGVSLLAQAWTRNKGNACGYLHGCKSSLQSRGPDAEDPEYARPLEPFDMDEPFLTCPKGSAVRVLLPLLFIMSIIEMILFIFSLFALLWL